MHNAPLCNVVYDSTSKSPTLCYLHYHTNEIMWRHFGGQFSRSEHANTGAWSTTNIVVVHSNARGLHLYVPCKSVCDRDQSVIARKVVCLRANQGNLWSNHAWSIKNARLCNLTYDPWKTKRSRTLEGNNQLIKLAHFSLIPVRRKRFNRWHESAYTSCHVKQD